MLDCAALAVAGPREATWVREETHMGVRRSIASLMVLTSIGVATTLRGQHPASGAPNAEILWQFSAGG